jgi:tetratricopeptide (TPR) repeat protein
MLRNSLDDALGYYDRAVVVDPDLAEAWFFVAKINLFKEKYDPAIDAMKKAIALDYPEREMRLWLGAALENTGKIKEAISEYKMFVAENPNHPKTSTIKLHISDLEFWDAPDHFESHDRTGGDMKPWEDTITPLSDPTKPWNEGTAKPQSE